MQKFKETAAFTLIELMVVLVMTGILTVGFAINLNGLRDQSRFADIQSEVLSLIQKTRGLSRTSTLVDENFIEFYYLQSNENGLLLRQWWEGIDFASDSLLETLDLREFELENLVFEFSTDSETELDYSGPLRICYFPPDGEVFIMQDLGPDALPGVREQICQPDSQLIDASIASFTICQNSSEEELTCSEESQQREEIRLSIHGGFPEIISP